MNDHDLSPQHGDIASFDGLSSSHVRLTYGGNHPSRPEVPIGPAGGADIPDWWSQEPDIYEAGVSLFATENAHVWPGYGIVANGAGQVPRATHAEAAYLFPDFTGLPRVQAFGDQAMLDVNHGPIPEIGPCVVTMPWGGNSNYGHFVLDCLPTVRLALNVPSLAAHRFIFPPLKEWHREHLRLAGLPNWDELGSDVVRSSVVVHSNIMDHYLHGPGQPVVDLREHQLAAAGPASADGTRLFLTREGHGDRHFENEAVIAKELEAIGFISLDPAKLSVEDQIRLFRGASAIVGATGAAFTNALYAPPGCQVIELQPEFLRGVWVRNLSQRIGLRYSAYFVPAEHASTPTIVGGVERPELGQTFAVDAADFATFVESSLSRP